MSELFTLHGRWTLVTGAAGHIGKALCEGLASVGCNLVIVGRDVVKLQALAGDLAAFGTSVEVAPFDVTAPDEVRAWATGTTVDRLDCIVNNAYSGSTASFEAVEEAAFLEAVDVSVLAAFRLVRELLPKLRRAVQLQGHASVVNIASMYAKVSPYPPLYEGTEFHSSPAYGAAKAALVQLGRHLACELAPSGIRVNTVSPGPIPSASAAADSRFMEGLASRVPLGRVGKPHEVAGAVTFLASDAATFITGSDLAVDGGWTAW